MRAHAHMRVASKGRAGGQKSENRSERLVYFVTQAYASLSFIRFFCHWYFWKGRGVTTSPLTRKCARAPCCRHVPVSRPKSRPGIMTSQCARACAPWCRHVPASQPKSRPGIVASQGAHARAPWRRHVPASGPRSRPGIMASHRAYPCAPWCRHVKVSRSKSSPGNRGAPRCMHARAPWCRHIPASRPK